MTRLSFLLMLALLVGCGKAPEHLKFHGYKVTCLPEEDYNACDKNFWAFMKYQPTTTTVPSVTLTEPYGIPPGYERCHPGSKWWCEGDSRWENSELHNLRAIAEAAENYVDARDAYNSCLNIGTCDNLHDEYKYVISKLDKLRKALKDGK